MDPLNLPAYDFNLRKQGQNTEIFDSFRRRFIALTPEEWVRQHILRFMVESRGVPSSLIAVEMEIGVGKLTKRCDAVIYDRSGNPIMIIECKASSVAIKQQVFDQAARYNIALKVDLLLITNGIQHYCCRVDHQGRKIDFLNGIPHFSELIQG